MIVALFALCAVFALCEILHFKREGELIRRLACRNEEEYDRYYGAERTPSPPSPSREAMKRWKKGE